MITAQTSLVDVAFEVCTALDAAGYIAVLTGGSAATYYAPAAIQSDDIDFVFTLRGREGPEVLARLGYVRSVDFYEHPESRFPLEFPPGPLAVGDELITTWDTVVRGEHRLHILSPTDSCRDRLSQFLFWNDFSSLKQALLIQRAHPDRVDLDLIRSWCQRERQLPKYQLFIERLGR